MQATEGLAAAPFRPKAEVSPLPLRAQPMQFSPMAERLSVSGADAWTVHNEATRLRATGRDVTFLTIGDPDQAAPEVVVEAAVSALRRGRKGYSPYAGLPAVRAAIAARIERRTGRACASANVIVMPGAQAGVFAALQCVAGAGDEVILPEPVYATYPAVISACGARMVNVPLDPARGFHPDLAAMERAITPRTRAIWINTPHNPTGAVFDEEEMNAIAALCRRHDLWLISDEVYEDMAYARAHVSAWSLADMADRTIVVSSLSKSHAIPGFRFGWVAGPAPLVERVTNLVLCMLFGGPPFIQEGVLPALERDLPEVAALRETYRRRSAAFSALLEAAPRCRLRAPEGGMFALLDVRPTGLPSLAFARRLLDEESVAVLPCDAFGPSAAGHVRISLTLPEPELMAAGRKIVAFAARLASEAEDAQPQAESVGGKHSRATIAARD
ncbi:MAG: aruH [Caulobacteraceae bacterium]|jgi:arginine:pyruvate transaminase|nr:aruH [Caulobacteraceae bacterium]